MTKITIEQLTEVYKITCGDTEGMIYGTENLLKEIQSLLNVSQKVQNTSTELPTSFFNTENNIITPPEKKLAVPVAKPGVTRGKVWNLLDDGYSISEIAEKLGLTESAIAYHEKSYVPKNVQEEIEDPDADLRPLITKYQNTGTNYDGGSIDEVD